MRVHGALGRAGGAGRIQPEARLVGDGLDALEVVAAALEQRVERPVASLVRHHHVAQAGQSRRQAVERRQQRAGHEQHAGARVAEHVLVVLGLEQRVDGHRHDAGLDRTQEGHRPVGAVEHAHDDPVLGPQPQAGQRRGKPVHASRKFGIRAHAAVVDEGGFGTPAGAQVALDQVVRGVVVAGNLDGGRRAPVACARKLGHRLSPGARRVAARRRVNTSRRGYRPSARSRGSTSPAQSMPCARQTSANASSTPASMPLSPQT